MKKIKKEFKDGEIINYKALLIQFLKRKNNIISRLMKNLQDSYLYKEDIEEIQKVWTDEECKESISKITLHTDAKNCPWCIKNNNNCVICNYMARHGSCFSDNSTYQKMRTALKSLSGYGYLNSIKDICYISWLTQEKNNILSSIKRFKSYGKYT